jgi:general secretion pathway protein G
MIELIFVIVIIGILAAVAIPKLTATRDDAKIAQVVANLRTFTEDVKNYYTANGEDAVSNPSGAWGVANYDVVSDTIDKAAAAAAATGGAAAFNIGFNSGEQCFTITEGTRNVTLNGLAAQQRILTITDGPDAATRVCVSALNQAQRKGLHTPAGSDVVVFAGQGVAF